jgi:hypothetical protein
MIMMSCFQVETDVYEPSPECAVCGRAGESETCGGFRLYDRHGEEPALGPVCELSFGK